MEIKKILKVESSVHLYRVLDNIPEQLELLDGDSLLRVEYYQSLASEYLYGCHCMEDINWEKLCVEYESLKQDSGLIEELCKVLGCDRLDFME